MSAASALALGFLLDLLLGDPPRAPHCVVAIGGAVSGLEKAFRRFFPASPRGELAAGALLVLAVAVTASGLTWLALAALARAHPLAGWAGAALVAWQALAVKGLGDAGLAVHRDLSRGDLAGARRAVARMVGRDTGDLDASGVARAAVESVAENASDAVVAPMLFFAVGGAPGAVLYKAINTMDSMLGYRNDRYLYFGRAAARLDDAANYLPARLTALLLIASAALCRLDWRGAVRILRRDRARHASPNAGHPEAACAGALGIRLGGDARYGGRLVAKPSIGDPIRPIEPEDIRRANRLLYGCAVLACGLCCLGRYLWERGFA